jgi:hypothetical protein
MTVSLPTTKQARRIFSSAMKRHGISIEKTKTRDKVSLSGIDYDLWVKLYRNEDIRSKLRTVEFHVTFEDMDQLTSAMTEFESMMTLSGKLFDNRRSWKYRYGSNYKIIKVICTLP